MSGTIHIEAMEMQSGGLVTQLVVNIDNDPVPNSGGDVRDWPLPIDANGRAREAVWLGRDPGDIEVIGHCGSNGRRNKQEEYPHG